MHEESFEDLFERSVHDFHRGEIVEGKVVNISDNSVYIDIAYKSESIISLEEFEETPSIGDTVQVMVMAQAGSASLQISKKEADILTGKKEILEAYKTDGVIEGRVSKRVKGGYIVSIRGVEAFLPGSHLALDRQPPIKEPIKQKFLFKIEQYNPQTGNLVISRKHYLEEEREKKCTQLLNSLQEGELVEAAVQYIQDNSIILTIDEVLPAILFLKDLSWTRIKDCRALIKPRQRIQAKVLQIDKESKKIQLGVKQMTADPLDDFLKKHKQGDSIEGKVVQMTDFGAFVQFMEGVEGMIHISELSWTKRIRHPRDILKIGDYVSVRLLSIDKEKRRISLSLRQIEENPWDSIESNYPKGKRVTGKILNIEAFGIFIGLDDEIVGLLHKTNIDWGSTTDISSKGSFRKGQKIDVIVLDFDRKNQTISLGLKQLLENPYEIFRANHPKGSTLSCTIKKSTPGGLVVDLEEGLEGFIPASEFPKQTAEHPQTHPYSPGQELQVAVKQIDLVKSKIILSLKDYDKQEEKRTLRKYITDSKELQDHSVSLGEIISFQNLIKK